jgi:hypothetical protein
MYAIDAKLTTDGWSAPWNTILNELDKAFIAESYPQQGPNTGNFNTMEVRPWYHPRNINEKRMLFNPVYPFGPKTAIGLTSLDIQSGRVCGVRSYIDQVIPSSMDVHIDGLGDCIFYSGAATFLDTKDSDFQIGSVVIPAPMNPIQPVTFPTALQALPRLSSGCQVLQWGLVPIGESVPMVQTSRTLGLSFA